MKSLLQANIVELAAVAVRTATLNGGAVDLRGYGDQAQVVLASAAGTGTAPTLDVKLQESADGSTGWTDIAGAAFAQVTNAADSTQMLAIKPAQLKRYVRVVGTKGGTSPSFAYGVVMLGMLKAGRNASQVV